MSEVAVAFYLPAHPPGNAPDTISRSFSCFSISPPPRNSCAISVGSIGLVVFVLFVGWFLKAALAENVANHFSASDKASSRLRSENNISLNLPNDEIPERVLYEKLFQRVISLSTEAVKQEQQGFPKRAESLRTYFQRNAGLTDGQVEKLSEVGSNFQEAAKEFTKKSATLRASLKLQPDNKNLANEFDETGKQREQLYLGFRDALCDELGLARCERFTQFVQQNFASRIKRFQPNKEGAAKDSVNAYVYGVSDIDYNSGTNVFSGYASTEVDQWGGGYPIYDGLVCDPEKSYCWNVSVDSRMTDFEGKYLAGDYAEGCNGFVEVYYYSDPNIEVASGNYCVDSDHVAAPNFSPNPNCYLETGYGGNSYACRTVRITPHINSLAPAAAIQGDVTIDAQMLGTGFGQYPTINVSGNGVTAEYIRNTPGGIEVYFHVSANATIGDHNVTVTSEGRTSNSMVFRIGDRSPQITSITPPQANTGEQVQITLNGTDFGVNPTLRVSGLGVAATIISSTPTQIQAWFAVAQGTYAGMRDVNVISRGVTGTGFSFAPGTGNSDTSNGVGFDVAAPIVQIGDIPVVEKNGEQSVNVSVSGLANAGDMVKLTLKPLSGATGEARFDNNSNVMQVPNGTHILTIKGVTESSQVNQMTLEATPATSSNVLAHKEFTVATISSLVFEKFDATYTDLDNNPGNGRPMTNIGQRIYPDKKDPVTDTQDDRRLTSVKATVRPAMPGLPVHFANFDLDDPSSDATPLDFNQSMGNDNNGTVSGSQSGMLEMPAGVTGCGTSTHGVSCPTGTDGTVKVNFTVTMQPGDNFTVAAGLKEAYVGGILVDSTDGTKLVDGTNRTIPISGEGQGDVPAIRTQMLTVWRKIHIEYDRMERVTGNYVTGTILKRKILNRYNTISLDTINDPSGLLEISRFQGGTLRIRIGTENSDFLITANTSRSVTIFNPGPTLSVGNTSVTLYDDDDYNQNNDYPIGDETEPVQELADTFRYLSAPGGLNSGGTNVYSIAYITPDYDWANGKQYNQANLPFDLNLEGSEVDLNAYRGSRLDERDEFWVAYFIIGYQGPLDTDADGDNLGIVGLSQGGNVADCLRLPTQNTLPCPDGGIVNSQLPSGGNGSYLFEEVSQDAIRGFPGVTLNVIGATTTHELGHQFGLKGDMVRTTFKLMDYPDYMARVLFELDFHEEHLNILRKRVHSPGN